MGRLIAVLKPVQHTVSLSRRRFYVYIAVLWIFAVLTTALLQILDEFTNTFTRNRLASRTLNQTSETTPFSNLRIPSKFVFVYFPYVVARLAFGDVTFVPNFILV